MSRVPVPDSENVAPDRSSSETNTTIVPTINALPAHRLRRVTAYIDENLHRELRLSDLSAVVHMSPFHFARLFKRSTGMSPHRFVIQRRVDDACARLSTQTGAIAAIARSVGFRAPSHFTTTFRRITGVTPIEYRTAASRAKPAR